MINFVLTPDWVEAILGTIEGLSFICSSLIVLRYIIGLTTQLMTIAWRVVVSR